MSRQEERSITLYDGKAYGHKVSDYAFENGYLDYLTLSKIVGDCVLNNNIFEYVGGMLEGSKTCSADSPYVGKEVPI